MGGGMEVDLTHGAVAAMSRLEEGLRPVLQVAGNPRLVSHPDAGAERYSVLLSDGVCSQEGVLATSLNGLVSGGVLREGSVVRVLDYFCCSVQNGRIIVVIQLEILQTECLLIGNPAIYEVNATESSIRFYSGGLGIHGTCMNPRVEQGVTNISCSLDQGLLGSSIAPGAEHAMNNLPFGRFYGSVPTQHTIDAKMQQLSLNPQGQRLSIPSTDGGFDCPGNTYEHPVQPLYQQPPHMYVNRGPVGNNEAPPCVIPIGSLSPYQDSWTIKARLIAKTDIRCYKNNRGAGKVFSFDLLDAQGGEIRATCFNSMAYQLSDQIVVGNVYFISRGSLRPAHKLFNPLNNGYETSLDNTSSVETCSGDDTSIPRQQYNFRRISELENLDNGGMVDLLGVVTSVSPPVTIMRKNGMGTQKRTLQLKDMSGQSMEITLWGNFCNAEGQQLQSRCDSGSNPILALKGGRISELIGKSVGTTSSSQLQINPDIPQAESLRQWYITEGKINVWKTSSSQLKINPDIPEVERLKQWYLTEGKTDVWNTIAQIKDENLGRSGRPEWITVKAVISYVNTEAFCYPACTLMFNAKQCSKKVSGNGDGTWLCRRCQQSCGTCDYRYLLCCQIQDHTGSTYAIVFQDTGKGIVGFTAQELFMIKNVDNDDAKFQEIMKGILWHEYIFKLRIKEETFDDEVRVKCTIVKADKLDASGINHRVLGAITGLLKNNPCSAPEAQGAGLTSLASPNVQAECFKCNRCARSATMIRGI